MEKLLDQIKACSICKEHLPLGPNPVVSAHKKSTIAVIGQAPGIRVHKSSVPWDDPSGERLRDWLGIDYESFYDPTKLALIPMGFCYPGTGKSGDLPPRKECAPSWHDQLLNAMEDVQLTLLIGNYAQKYYLKSTRAKNLTETVKNYKAYLPNFLPLPHPSPRNNIWLKKNPWFERGVLPELRRLTAIYLK